MARKIIKANTVRQKYGDISNTTMHRYIANGTIRAPFKVGRVNAWFEDEIDADLEQLAAA